MPKDSRTNSLSSERARGSPYDCSSKSSDKDKYDSFGPPAGDEKEWEEARCPICMEHPHNAILLSCSSSEKGCRPFMCNTSHRHSNCYDQFKKSCTVETIRYQPEIVNNSRGPQGGGEPCVPSWSRISPQTQIKLVCPLCRGHICGWAPIKAAREYMNCKPRSCSLETCSFTGNYTDLRKHARNEHPNVRPTEADLSRQSEWRMLERQTDFEDTLSIFHSFGDAVEDDTFLDDAPSGSMFDFLMGVESESEDDSTYSFNNLLELESELDFSFLSDLVTSPTYFPVEFRRSAINNQFRNQILESPRPNDETQITRRRWDTIPRRARSSTTRRRWYSSTPSQFRGSSL